MGIKFEDYLARLPEKDREIIAAGTAELIQEEATLRELREIRSRSQAQLAEKLHTGQAAVSKMERRTDMYISNLRNFIRAMGGELDIVARFPDRPPVRIKQFGKLA
jgi:hypothetical protein